MSWVTDQLLVMPGLPMEFRSHQTPLKFSHFSSSSLPIAPSGASLENTMYCGRKLRANKTASKAVSRSNKNTPEWRHHHGQGCGFLTGSICPF